MADRLADRFRNLERARRPKGMSTVGEADGRIGAIESGAGQAAPNPSMARSHLERFQTPAEPGLDTTRPREGAQPFTRCQRCETDNSSFTGVCSTCGADLGTREQRLFNERLWEQRQREKQLEEREAAVREAERGAATTAAEQARRAMGVELAREVGERERARLEGGYGRWGGPGSRYDDWGDAPPDSTPYGVRLLRRITNPAWRIGVIVALVAVPVLLIVFGGHGGARVAGFIGVILLAALFSPPGYRYRRRGFWGW